jgi:hypothetical protein
MRRPLRPAALATLASVMLTGLSGCDRAHLAMPACRADRRLGIVAQSVPEAIYVPCIERLAAGWSFGGLEVEDGSTSFTLRSDRNRVPVRISFRSACDVGRATPVAPRAEGVRTFQLVRTISPRYGARQFDVFAGGCVTYDYDFARGPHIALTDELLGAVRLFSRQELRTGLARHLGVRLDP